MCMWVCIYTYVFSPERYLSNKEHHLTPRSQIFFFGEITYFRAGRVQDEPRKCVRN